jgi:hypothetical protein
MKTIAGALMLSAALLTLPADASAQEERWTPWLGCWTLVNENTHEGAGAARAAFLSPVEPSVPDPENEPRTCVARASHGVTITTTVPNQAPTVQTLFADDVSRPLTDDECRGTERTSWSVDGRLLFARADVTCADATPRTITGLGLITTRGEWLDVRTFRIDGRYTTRVSRYQRVDGTPTMGHHLTVAEIKEASRAVSPAAVEAAIAETRPLIVVKSKLLLELSDAHVPPSVIDMLVAVAYPREFVVNTPSSRSAGGAASYGAYGLYDPIFDLSYYPSYYYSPFAYGYIGRYNPILFPPYWTSDAGAVSGGDSIPARGTGRAINGEGYTRARPSSSTSRPVVNGGSGGMVSSSSSGPSPSPAPAAASDSGASGSSGGSSGGGSGGGTPQGYSSGGADSGAGRTAQPR